MVPRRSKVQELAPLGDGAGKPRRHPSSRQPSPDRDRRHALPPRARDRRHEELSTREVSPIELEGLFPEFARRLRNEIFARHGRIFRDKKLQSYFASFDWYKPDPKFDERTLTPIEKTNVRVILGHERRAKQGLRFNPG